MKKVKKLFQKAFKASIMLSIISFVFGLAILLDTGDFLEVLSTIVGWSLLIFGLIFIVRYFLSTEKYEDLETSFKFGIMIFIIGLILVIFKNIIYITVPLIIAIMMVINSINKIDLALIMRREKNEKWYYSLIIGIITLIAGICLLVNPLGGTFLVTKVIGIIIIVSSLLDLIDTLNLHKEIKKTGKKLKEIFK